MERNLALENKESRCLLRSGLRYREFQDVVLTFSTTEQHFILLAALFNVVGYSVFKELVQLKAGLQESAAVHIGYLCQS